MSRLFRLIGALLRLGAGPAGPAAAPPPAPPLPAIAGRVTYAAPWIPLTDPVARACFDHELRTEVIPGHPLHGVGATAIGRIDGGDDILYALDDGRLAAVHLTFVGKPEQSPRWPACALYDTVEDWSAVTR